MKTFRALYIVEHEVPMMAESLEDAAREAKKVAESKKWRLLSIYPYLAPVYVPPPVSGPKAA
ncbi:MAG: hypothetical protein KGL39_48770 [Patescibacteria group bacterium]|nr:hypothetical protein [Patescibacteria group bacterium]